jgi:hypothetical protein
MRFGNSIVDDRHRDYSQLRAISDGIERRLEGRASLQELLPGLIKEAVDFVLDPVRTGRTRMAELDKVEKTFIGLKIEHYLRDLLNAPRGKKRDMEIDGVDVDIKNTIGASWMIPRESYRVADPCLLIATAKFDGRCWLGLMIARDSYLNPGKNQDSKRSVSADGRRNIMWLVEDAPYPPSSWDGIDMSRFRELRRMKGGAKRAATFFRENLDRVVNRQLVQALMHDQLDYMRRMRGGESGKDGARAILAAEGISLWSGVYDKNVAMQHGVVLAASEWCAMRGSE